MQFTTADVLSHPIKPTTPRYPTAWQHNSGGAGSACKPARAAPNPGRSSAKRRRNSVQRTGATPTINRGKLNAHIARVVMPHDSGAPIQMPCDTARQTGIFRGCKVDGLVVYEVKAKYRLKFDQSSRRIRPPDAGRFHEAFEHIRSVTSKWLNARHWPPDRLRFGGARHNYSRRILW